MRLEITLPGKPYPQPRIRVSKFGAYHPKEHKQKIKKTSMFLKESADLQKWEYTEGPIRVTIVTVCRLPKRFARKRKPIVAASGKRFYKISKPDIDNYTKYILDAATYAGNIWLDDSQVTELIQKKFTGNQDEEPYTNVIIEPITTEGLL